MIFEVSFSWSLGGESSVLVEANSQKHALEVFLRSAGPKIHVDRLQPTNFIVNEPEIVKPFYPSMLVQEMGDDDEIIYDCDPPEIDVDFGYQIELPTEE